MNMYEMIAYVSVFQPNKSGVRNVGIANHSIANCEE